MLEATDFAILPWDWPIGDQETFNQMRECGFNLAGFVAPEHLDLVKQAGLKGIVFERNNQVGNAEAQLDEKEIALRVEALVNRVDHHPAAFGYYLRDEPGADIYPGLRRWADAYKKFTPGSLAYINLFPNYASAEQMNVPTYADYLESYIQIVQPSYISYDHYAMMDDGCLRDGYFQNLEAVRSLAQRNSIPFWNIVLANSHFHYAEPTPATLRFQLYTTLAYGARGISYFTYFAPRVGNYRLAPVDQFGYKTPTWDMLRNVNLQLHRIGPTYIGLKSTHVFHHPDVPAGCAGIATSRLVATLEGESGESETGFLVGEFERKGGEPYALVVNKSLHCSTAFQITFKLPGRVFLLNAYTGQTEPWTGEQVWLAPGQGMLLCIKKE